MKWDDLVIRVLEYPDAEPSFDLNPDKGEATFIYGGNALDLLRLGIAAGRQMGRRVIPMQAITQPE